MVRFKNRYLLCVLETNDPTARIEVLQPRDILQAIRASLSENFGEIAAGQLQSSLTVKLWSPALHMCIIRASRDHFRVLWGAVCLVTTIRNSRALQQVRFRVIHVGGTIRACQKSAAQHGRQIILAERARGRATTKLEFAVEEVNRDVQVMDI